MIREDVMTEIEFETVEPWCERCLKEQTETNPLVRCPVCRRLMCPGCMTGLQICAVCADSV